MATYASNTASESEQRPSNNGDEDQDQDQPERERVEVDKEYFDEVHRSLEHLTRLFNILQINPSVAPPSPSQSDEIRVPLGSTEVTVPRSELQKVKRKSIKSYTEGLVDLLFAPETLRTSTLKGKSSKGQPRDTLDPVKVNAIIEQVRSVFQDTRVDYVEQLIRNKCNCARK
ncbi:hypothetical protein AOLI_G00127780 [Acnodon oligacanthus]